MRDDPGGIFESDEHRRVAGNLSQPRSVGNLLREFDTDPYTDLTESDVGDVLKDLEADGLVANLGTAESGEDLVAAAAKHKLALTLPDEKGSVFAERATRLPSRYLDGEQWILTEEGRAKLSSPHPNEPPPLVGTALQAAEEHNEKLAEAARKAEEEAGR